MTWVKRAQIFGFLRLPQEKRSRKLVPPPRPKAGRKRAPRADEIAKEKAAGACCGLLALRGKLEFPALIRGTLTNSDSGDDSSRDDCNSDDGSDNGNSGRGTDKGNSGGDNNMPKQASARPPRTARLPLRHR